MKKKIINIAAFIIYPFWIIKNAIDERREERSHGKLRIVVKEYGPQKHTMTYLSKATRRVKENVVRG